MLTHQFQELLDKYSAGDCSPEEEQFITDWYNNIGKNEKDALGAEEEALVGAALWSAISPGPSPVKTRFWGLARAAVISIPILACAAFYFNRQSLARLVTANQEASPLPRTEKKFLNETGSAQAITLPDGSEVVLQPSTEVYVSEDFDRTTREVRLIGEAFFKVKRNPRKPFVVFSNEVVTRVLGTSFNVRAYENDGEITVAVKTGKVSVYAAKNQEPGIDRSSAEEVILTPNQKMVYHRKKEKVLKRLVEKPEIILPNSNLFALHFENTEISSIFSVLEENYGIEIRYDKKALTNCRLTTSMSDEGLYERIEVICKAIGASYTIADDAVITIESDGC